MHKSRSILQKIPPLRLAVYLISAALFIAMAVIAVRQGMAGWPEEGPAVVLGNAALSRAAMLLRSLPLQEENCRMADRAVTVNLATNPFFMDQYIQQMMF